MDPERLEALRRASGLRLDAEGVFWFRDRPVENPRVQALFHRGLAVREDGEVTLTVGEQWCYVESMGPARFVEALSEEGGALRVRYRSGEEAVVRRPILGAGADGRFYLWEDACGVPAVLLRAAHQSLGERLEEGPGGAPGLRLAAGFVSVRPLAAAPRAGSRPGDLELR